MSSHHRACSRRFRRDHHDWVSSPGAVKRPAGSKAIQPAFGNQAYDVGLQLQEKAKQFEYHKNVARAELARHLLDYDRLNALLFSEVAHVTFGGRDGTGDEGRLEFAAVESSREPYDVFSRASDIQPVNYSNDSDSHKKRKKLKKGWRSQRIS